MLSQTFKRRIVEFVPIIPKVTILQPVQSAENGIMSKRSAFSTFDIAGSLSGFTSTDFSIGNLLSIGAMSKLTTTYMASMSDMNIADKFESLNFESNVPQT